MVSFAVFGVSLMSFLEFGLALSDFTSATFCVLAAGLVTGSTVISDDDWQAPIVVF